MQWFISTFQVQLSVTVGQAERMRTEKAL